MVFRHFTHTLLAILFSLFFTGAFAQKENITPDQELSYSESDDPQRSTFDVSQQKKIFPENQHFVFNSNLPIVKITTPSGQEIMDEPRITASMGIIYNGDGQVNSSLDPFNNYDGKVAIEYRGTSSLFFDKKGYGFETRNEDESNNNVSLIDLPEENDWILNGPYADKSLLRNMLTYHLGNLTGQYAPRTRLCELFIDNEYLGIYVLTEKIKQDKNRVDIAKLTEIDNETDELTGGYIVKIDRNDQNIPGAGWTSTFPDNKFFAYVEPKDDQITSQQKSYIQNYMYDFEFAMAGTNVENIYANYIDEQSFVDYFLVTEIGKHIDAFKLSFYLYKDKDSNGGKLKFGPLWDFNLGYGNFDFACSPDPQGWAYEFPDCGSWHPFWARKLADVPNIQHLSNCRWQELRAGPFQTDSLLHYIDEKAAFMGSAVDRNFDRWQILGQYVWPNDFVGETYEDEIQFLKEWVEARLLWMDNNMVGVCEDYVTATVDHVTQQLNIYPNPSTNFIKVDWNSSKPANLTIYDIHHKVMLMQPIDAEKISEIHTDFLASGLYVVVLRSAENDSILHTKKIAIVD